MIKTLFRGIGGGFGRVLGRFICYIFIGVAIYFIMKYFNVDILPILPKLRGYILI